MVTQQIQETSEAEAPALLKLDLGSGVRPREGFVAVDIIAFTPETQVVDLAKPIYADGGSEEAGRIYELKILGYEPWPWEDSSVGEVFCSHFIEHLDARQRVHFFNELYRVLAPGKHKDGKPVQGFATIVTPHWSSCRAFGDPTHKWPPVSDFAWHYLSRKWRLGVEGSDKLEDAANAPHTDASFVPGMYDCDFDCSWGYSYSEELGKRNPEFVQFALQNFRDAAQDGICTVVSRKPE